MKKLALILLGAGLLCPVLLMARQGILLNGSMEYGPGPSGIDPHQAANWTYTGGPNIERSDTVSLVPPTAGHALKAFGDGNNTNTNASQIVPNIAPGNSVTASVSLYTPDFDKLGGSGSAGLVLEFLNAGGGTIVPGGGPFVVYGLNAGSLANTWLPVVVGPYTAPAGTTQARVTCRLQWSVGDISGAAYWDDARVVVGTGSNLVVNGDFETAGNSPGQSPLGIDDWTGFGDQEKSADIAARDGVSTLRMGVRETYSGLYQNMRALQAGDHLYMKAWAWNPSATPLTSTTRAGLKLEFASNEQVPSPVENLAFDETAARNTWTLVTVSTVLPTTPAGLSAKMVCIFNSNSGTTGRVHFDSAWAERSSAPGVNLLLNSGFELGPGGSNGLDSWTEFGTSTATCQKSCLTIPAHDGSCTARATGQSAAGVYQIIGPFNPGETLTLQAWLYTPSSAPLTGTGTAGVKIEWVLGAVPDPVDIGGPNNTITASSSQNVWLPLTIDYTMPSGSNAITRYVCLIEKGAAFTGYTYFDACEAVVINRFNGSDVDGDNDEDLEDFAWFQLCYSGTGGTPLKYNGVVFDNDNNQYINMVDFNYFAPRMTGPHAEP